MSTSSIAFNRFGLGARPGDGVSGDPEGWVLAQCDRFEARPAAIAGAPSTASVSAGLATYFAEQKAIRTQFGPRAAKPVAGAIPDPMAAPVPAMSAAMAPPDMAAAEPGEAARQAARQRAGKLSRDDYGAASLRGRSPR